MLRSRALDETVDNELTAVAFEPSSNDAYLRGKANGEQLMAETASCELAVWKSTCTLLYDWQTLLAGILALMGALITVLVVVRQIRSARDDTNSQIRAAKEDTDKQIGWSVRLEEERRRRDERAAKAVLPLAISPLIEYALECIILLSDCKESDNGVEIGKEPIPVIPTDVIMSLREVARHADDAVSKQVETLLSKLQVQHARMTSQLARKPLDGKRKLNRFESLGLVWDAADLYAHIARLFSYARDEDALRTPATAQEIMTPVRIAGIYPETHPTLYGDLEKRIELRVKSA